MSKPGYDAKVLTPKQYAEGWAKMMVDIWHEKMQEYEVWESGDLWRSFNKDWVKWNEDTDKGRIMHQFLQYGIYVERGTGREKDYGNSGDIGEFQQNGEERFFRIPKPWLTKKYLYSIHRLSEHFAAQYGNQFCRMIKYTLEEKVG